jgi:hypothetical protein
LKPRSSSVPTVRSSIDAMEKKRQAVSRDGGAER